MNLSASKYLEILKQYVNNKYVEPQAKGGGIILKEKFFIEDGARTETRNIKMLLPGPGLTFKLDRDNVDNIRKKSKLPRLFHFLDDHGKPWSKRCDFVVFYVHGQKFHADCIEFKSNFLQSEDIALQLGSGASWVKSLKKTIQHYTTYTRRIYIRKFVFGTNTKPENYVDAHKQLSMDPSIRYYHFDEVQGQSLEGLKNTSVETV